MSVTELRKQLIDKIYLIQDENLLKEAFRLLDVGSRDLDVYKLSESQITAVNEAREQISKGDSVKNDEADREIDEWLRR